MPEKSPGPRAPMRTLADSLRSREPASLARLLGMRPDLALPLPYDLTGLAVRAAARASVQRAIDALDAPTLAVLEALASLPEPSTVEQLLDLFAGPDGPDRRQVVDAVARLKELALIWGEDDVYLVRAVRDGFGPNPTGLGPPLADLLGYRDREHLAQLAALLDPDDEFTGDPLDRVVRALTTPSIVDALLERAPAEAPRLLETLTWGRSSGRLVDADRQVSPLDEDQLRAPVRWLLAHGLLAALDHETVAMPREIALHLRGGRVFRDVRWREPEPLTRPVPQHEATAAYAAAELVRLVEALCEHWAVTEVPVLRSGGLGMRELRRTATALEVTEAVAAFLAELAAETGLVVHDDEIVARWAPSQGYDDWLDLPLGRRWAALAAAWLDTARCPALAGTRDEKGALRNVFGIELFRLNAAELRRWVLDQLAAQPPGLAIEPSSLTELLDWSAPRRGGASRTSLLEYALTEAELVGVTGGGALADYARPLLAGDPTAAAEGLESALPEPVEHLVLQADLTAVVPGRLAADPARELELLADPESRGHGSVYRFSATSIRRALDAGRSAQDIASWLVAHSRTEVPQPLSYLVSDVARRHGVIRVGTATAFIRSDDEAALSELLVNRKAAALQLRRLAPSVLISPEPPETVLEVLRSAGLSPAAETADGVVVFSRSSGYRARGRLLSMPRSQRSAPPTEAALLSAATTLRMSDPVLRVAASGAVPDEPPFMDDDEPTDVTAVLTLLRRAATDRRPVWVGYVESDGSRAQRLVEPIEVYGGRVSAFDRQTARMRVFPVSRVVSVVPA